MTIFGIDLEDEFVNMNESIPNFYEVQRSKNIKAYDYEEERKAIQDELGGVANV